MPGWYLGTTGDCYYMIAFLFLEYVADKLGARKRKLLYRKFSTDEIDCLPSQFLEMAVPDKQTYGLESLKTYLTLLMQLIGQVRITRDIEKRAFKQLLSPREHNLAKPQTILTVVRCGEAETDTKDTQYVGDFIRREYHDLNCKLILKMENKNWTWFSSVTEVMDAGYKPCESCAPATAESRIVSSPRSNLWISPVLETIPKALWRGLAASAIVLGVSSLVFGAVLGIIGGVPVITLLITMLVVWLIKGA